MNRKVSVSIILSITEFLHESLHDSLRILQQCTQIEQRLNLERKKFIGNMASFAINMKLSKETEIVFLELSRRNELIFLPISLHGSETGYVKKYRSELTAVSIGYLRNVKKNSKTERITSECGFQQRLLISWIEVCSYGIMSISSFYLNRKLLLKKQ